ncbi:histidine phosphatase family protein [Neobacillus sp. PS3-12]|uniref:histidine phosphatase family protein n=1 Tax=Neobacillus sp. PS3-12 TaxID=3070677 RepID=UPI0027DFF6CB|nr:histidine phosphatase family protein [Neobacillus sp. PS3-12]WML55603.1 histidine phosphatase family protein [Neobacillus sp. PS3-12]
MLNIYITRHGETQWNSENRLQGWKDSELTDNGKRNAVALGERLYQINFNTIYTSPIDRAVKTASLVCSDRNIPILFEDGLKEINLGDWEGKVKEEIEQTSKQEFFNFWNAPHLYNHEMHNGESFAALKSRVENVINRIIADNKEGNILIVTHGVTIRAILSYLMNIPTEKWWEGPFIEGTSLTLAQYDEGTFQVKMIGDTLHIKKTTSV